MRSSIATCNKTRRRNLSQKQEWTGFLFALPLILGIVALYLYPLLTSIYNSFFTFKGLDPVKFVGIDNYVALINERNFRMSVTNTLIFAAMAVPSGILFSIFVALMINVKSRFQGVYRVISFIPTLMPSVAISLIWMWLLNAQYGIVNYLFSLLGILGPPWFGSIAWAKPSLVLISLWGAGSTIMIYLAGLQDVPRELYESAKIDGAGKFAQFRKITLPLLSPVIFYNLIMSIIGSLQQFTIPFVITDGVGRPAGSLLFYAMMLYKYAFSYFQMGMACAMAWMMFIVVVILTVIVQISSKKWVYYMGE
jgi:multiple sugar transport system permease protein